MATTKRIAPGIYRTPDGYEIRKVEDWDGQGLVAGWHLIDSDGEYCNTFPTKRDALDATGELA